MSQHHMNPLPIHRLLSVGMAWDVMGLFRCSQHGHALPVLGLRGLVSGCRPRAACSGTGHQIIVNNHASNCNNRKA